jgi:hypothetical protein
MDKPITIGAPEKPKPDERTGFYIHKHLTCYLDVQPNGVYVDGKDPHGQEVFRVHRGNMDEAMNFIQHKKDVFAQKNGEENGEESRGRNSSETTSE